MPNLFPTQNITDISDFPGQGPAQVAFGRSWRFDFEAGEFVLTPAGRVTESNGADAWLEWCRKALRTQRYRYLIYSRNFGQEYEELITRNLTRSGNESEIKRTTTECLMVDPRTKSVSNFDFNWEDDKCLFTCEIANINGETGNISGSVVMG